MRQELILKQQEGLPDSVKAIFGLIDSKNFKALNDHIAEDFTLYFAHYTLKGVEQALGFVGTFDQRLFKYEHDMTTVLVSENGQVVTFEGILKVWLEDGTLFEAPFWDKITFDTEGKIKEMYALFSIAAFPEQYWKDLKPEQF